jgi:hypothetical protein
MGSSHLRLQLRHEIGAVPERLELLLLPLYKDAQLLQGHLLNPFVFLVGLAEILAAGSIGGTVDEVQEPSKTIRAELGGRLTAE